MNHTLWYLPNVASCFAMRNLLEKDNFFRTNYKVVVCAGTKAGIGLDALPPEKPAPQAALYGGQLSARAGEPSSPSSKAGETGTVDYAEGDTVRHVKFGSGTVLELKKSGKDYLVTVDFPSWGVKKMIASMARLAKVGQGDGSW